MELLIKKLLLFLFLSTIFFVGCNKSEKVEKEDSPDFYELCFYFPKLLSGTVQDEIDKATESYSDSISKSGINILSKHSSLLKSCWFLDKEPNIGLSLPKYGENDRVDYLLKAFFNQESSSLYGMKNSGKIIKKIRDGIPISNKLPMALSFDEGLSFKGWSAKMPYFSHYLDNIGIKHSFGRDAGSGLALNIPADLQERWKIALFFLSSIDLENTVKPSPGDFAIFALCGEEKIKAEVKKNGWNKTKIEKINSNNGKNAIVFKTGAANLPVSEEIALKYLYSLAKSHELPFESGSFYSPNFASSSVIPQLYIFSSKLLFSLPIHDSESLFLWTISSKKQPETYPDTFYANLLALKIAKKLLFADKTFLGGKELANKKQFIDFEVTRDSFFSFGNILVSGEMPENLYLFSGETIKESTKVADISEISGFKALFGDPKTNDTSLVVFVVRNKNAAETLAKIEKSLAERGFKPIHKIFEKIGDEESWGSISFKTPVSNEGKLMSLYDKEYKTLDKTLSIGVYRVSEK